MVKYLSFYNSSFALRYFVNLNGKAIPPCRIVIVVAIFLCTVKFKRFGLYWNKAMCEVRFKHGLISVKIYSP